MWIHPSPSTTVKMFWIIVFSSLILWKKNNVYCYIGGKNQFYKYAYFKLLLVIRVKIDKYYHEFFAVVGCARTRVDEFTNTVRAVDRFTFVIIRTVSFAYQSRTKKYYYRFLQSSSIQSFPELPLNFVAEDKREKKKFYSKPTHTVVVVVVVVLDSI